VPNGKPGDHPYTDIIVHGSSSEFGSEISDLVRTISKQSGFAHVRDRVAKVLEECTWYGRLDRKDDLIAEAKRRLETIADELDSRDA